MTKNKRNENPVLKALEVLGENVAATLRNDNLSYEQVRVRDAYRILKEFVYRAGGYGKSADGKEKENDEE